MNTITKLEVNSFQENVPKWFKELLLDPAFVKLKKHQNIGAHDTGDLYDCTPIKPDEIKWDPKSPGLGYVHEECDPYGCRAKVGYHPILSILSLFIPNILEQTGEHEGAHLAQRGKNVLLHIYYDSWDDTVKYGPIKSGSDHEYPVGRGIVEGGVKVARDKKGGVEQTSYKESSKFAEKLDRLLPLSVIHKLAHTTEKKLMQKKRDDPSFDVYDISPVDRPEELQALLYALNMPGIKDGIRSYATRSKADLYVV